MISTSSVCLNKVDVLMATSWRIKFILIYYLVLAPLPICFRFPFKEKLGR